MITLGKCTWESINMPWIHIEIIIIASIPWWRHQMEPFSALLAHPPVTGGFLSQRPLMWSYDTFFNLRLDKQLSKQSRRRWFETLLRSLWCHSTAIEVCAYLSGVVHAHSALVIFFWRVHLTLCSGLIRLCNCFFLLVSGTACLLYAW